MYWHEAFNRPGPVGEKSWPTNGINVMEQKIQSECEYHAALAEIEKWMEAPPDSPRNREMHELVRAVEAYEAEHHPKHLRITPKPQQ